MPLKNGKIRVNDILEAIEEAQKYPKNINISELAGKLFGIRSRMILPRHYLASETAAFIRKGLILFDYNGFESACLIKYQVANLQGAGTKPALVCQVKNQTPIGVMPYRQWFQPMVHAEKIESQQEGVKNTWFTWCQRVEVPA